MIRTAFQLACALSAMKTLKFGLSMSVFFMSLLSFLYIITCHTLQWSWSCSTLHWPSDIPLWSMPGHAWRGQTWATHSPNSSWLHMLDKVHVASRSVHQHLEKVDLFFPLSWKDAAIYAFNVEFLFILMIPQRLSFAIAFKRWYHVPHIWQT
jgi:hypothetical protein